jgi:DNA anti-recombination protein RmuC
MPSKKTVESFPGKNITHTPSPANTEKGDLDQIRDILFGDQVRRYDNQFLQLKSQIAQDMEQIRREMVEQIAAIKKVFGQANADMIEQLNVEKQQRTQSHSELSNTLQETIRVLQSRMDQGEQEIKALMEARLSGLSKHMDEQHQSMVTSTERMIADLENQKANSEDLSILFSEISSRLSGGLKDGEAPNATGMNP